MLRLTQQLLLAIAVIGCCCALNPAFFAAAAPAVFWVNYAGLASAPCGQEPTTGCVGIALALSQLPAVAADDNVTVFVLPGVYACESVNVTVSMTVQGVADRPFCSAIR